MNLNASGTPADRFSVRVYFEDTDFSGNVYHAAYLKFFERARTEFLRTVGVRHSDLLQEGLVFAVRDLTISYDRAAQIDDMLDIDTCIVNMSGARLVLDQSLSRSQQRICHARVTVVLVTESGSPARLPATLRERLARV